MQLSLLDNDFYAFTMGQLIWKTFPDWEVRYKFTNRGTVKLGENMSYMALAEQVAKIQRLRFTTNEIKYLRKLGMFEEDYLKFLQHIVLPEIEVQFLPDGNLHLAYEGPWSAAVFLETPLLAQVNHQYFKQFATPAVHAEGLVRLKETRDALKHSDIRFSEFGTRRRFSAEWQRLVVEELVDSVPDRIIGTSNVRLAKDLGLKPTGTMAHQLFMVLCPQATIMSQNVVLDLWEQTYDKPHRLALTDTYGTDYFLRHLRPEQAAQWAGFRQDSGDPTTIATKYLNYWEQNGIRPQDHSILFSDGLTLPVMNELHARFSPQTNVGFGWGTNLTNNMGLPALPIVIKPDAVIEPYYMPLVKLSDNIEKATGDPKAIEATKEAVGYRNTYQEDVTY